MESTFSKIVVIVIAIFVMTAGGAVAWYLLQTKAQPGTTNTDQNQYTTGNTSPNFNPQTTGTPPQNQQPIAASGMEGAYTALVGQLNAQKIAFTRIDGKTTGAAANIYALYAKDIVIAKEIYPDTTDFSIQAAANDLNGDGVAEAIVYEDLQGACGSGGCSIDIYQDVQDTWVKIFSGLGAVDMAASNSASGGYADLYLTVSDGTSKRVVRYAWDGTTYRAKQTVARWEGTALVKTP